MTSRTNAKLPMQNAPASGTPTTNPGSTYSPSVPISLYRQVATELQSTQTELETVQGQNQKLVEQNQQLRVEIERVVQSALQLRQVADSYKPLQPLPDLDTAFSGLELHFEQSTPPPAPPEPRNASPKAHSIEPVVASKQFTEQESQLRRAPQTDRAQEVGGWWLVLIIFLIVVTAFGTGFLIVRPLLPNR